MIRHIKSDFRNLSFRECWNFTRNWTVVLPIGAKLLRIPWYTSVGYSITDDIRKFEGSLGDLETELQEMVLEHLSELEDLGFHSPVYLIPRDNLVPGALSGMALLRHASGEHLGRIHFSRFLLASRVSTVKRISWIGFGTVRQDGSHVYSSTFRRMFDPPPGEVGIHRVGAKAAELWRQHLEYSRTELKGASPRPIRTDEELWEFQRQSEQRSLEHFVRRGVYRYMTDAEVTEQRRLIAAASGSPPLKPGEDPGANSNSPVEPDMPVLLEVEKLQRKKSPNSTTAWLIFGLSLVLFVPSIVLDRDFLSLGLLLGVLLFHELGHFLAMKTFGYRDLRMFFVPFLGAAVSGRNLRVPVWQEVLVLLAGPVPGLLLGAFVVPRFESEETAWIGRLANLLVGLNLFNLVPITPLDGGRVMEALVFRRHPWLEASFHAVAAMALIAFASSTSRSGIALGLLGFLMLMGVRHKLRLGRVVLEMQREATVLDDATTPGVSQGMARAILKRLRPRLPASRSNPALLAQDIETVYERLHSGRPGWLQTGVLLGAYAAAIAIPGWSYLQSATRLASDTSEGVPKLAIHSAPIIPVACDDTGGPLPGNTHSPAGIHHVTVIGTITNAVSPTEPLRSWTDTAGSPVSVVRFGNSVMITRDSDTAGWAGRMISEGRRRGLEMVVDQPGSNRIPSVVLEFTLLDGSARTNLLRELEEYESIASTFDVLPPWDPLWLESPADRTRWEEARRTWIDAWREVTKVVPKYSAESRERIAKSRAEKDTNAVERLLDSLHRQRQEAVANRLFEIAAGSTNPMTAAVVEILRQKPWPPIMPSNPSMSLSHYFKRTRSWADQSASLFGQNPNPEDSAQSTGGDLGFVGAPSLVDEAAIRWTGTPARIERTLPALVRFLCQRGATDIHYRILADDRFDRDD